MTWRRSHIGLERDDGHVGGLPVWAHEWKSVPGEVWLPEDAPPSVRERFALFEIGGVGWPVQVRFAAKEISNGVWSFWEDR
jgi:hypothetical protein